MVGRVIRHRLSQKLTSVYLDQRANAKNDSNILNIPVIDLASERCLIRLGRKYRYTV